jgi:hypothetical protein
LSGSLLPTKRLIGGHFTCLSSAHPIWVRGRWATGAQVYGFREARPASRIENSERGVDFRCPRDHPCTQNGCAGRGRVCLLWRGAFAGGGLGCLKTACYHAFKRHEARSLGKELERRLWDADTLITPSRVAELTHTMYEMSFTSPNDPQRRRILLPMNGEQRKAYEPCTDLGIPIRETGKIWRGWVGPLPVDLDSTSATPYNAVTRSTMGRHNGAISHNQKARLARSRSGRRNPRRNGE